MYRLEYLPLADLDIENAETYLYGYSPAAVDKLTEAIDKQQAILCEHPFMYPVYRLNPHYRCMPLPYKYLCFYRVIEEANLIQIYRILRAMQDIPNIL
jgi:plasmid stabilization system protein ParE